LEQWIVELDILYLNNIVLENGVYIQSIEYIERRQSIDETVMVILKSVEIYLYE